MKAICVVICAFMASALAASADSIEQTLDIFVTGAYQGVTTNSSLNRNVELDRIQLFRINSANVVHALAIDSGPNYSNYYNGTLIYKTSLDGSTTNVVIKRAGFPELDVTSNFVFTPGTFVVNQATNTTTNIVTGRVETGLMQLSFTSSSAQFSANGFAYGTSTRTHSAISGRGTNGTLVSGYANLLLYSGGSGLASINTNVYSFKTNIFAGTNLVTNAPAQILFKTYAPVFSTN